MGRGSRHAGSIPFGGEVWGAACGVDGPENVTDGFVQVGFGVVCCLVQKLFLFSCEKDHTHATRTVEKI